MNISKKLHHFPIIHTPAGRCRRGDSRHGQMMPAHAAIEKIAQFREYGQALDSSIPRPDYPMRSEWKRTPSPASVPEFRAEASMSWNSRQVAVNLAPE